MSDLGGDPGFDSLRGQAEVESEAASHAREAAKTAHGGKVVGTSDELTSDPTSTWRLALRRFRRRKLGMLGLAIVTTLTAVAILAPYIAPYNPRQPLDRIADVSRRDPPSSEYIMGLDSNARDQFSRILYGARVSLPLGVSIVLVAILVGASIGAVAGYAGGWIDNVLMRIMDVVLGFPALLLALTIAYVLGASVRNTLIAVAVVAVPQYARVMRSSVLSIKEIDYVMASQALGSSAPRLLLTRILPNALTPLVVLGTLGVATAILEAAALSFLGLGAQPPTPEWGAMLAESYTLLLTSPHLVIWPGVAIMVTVLGFNLLGDGLRDALDPSLNE